MTALHGALEAAARVSLHAPSVFNTQPWRWRLHGETLALYADRTRSLAATDPESRLLMLSCGAALHHARTALAAAGRTAHVVRLPEGALPDLLALVTATGQQPPSRDAERLASAILLRRTDRRAFSERGVAEQTLNGLRRAVEAEGAYLHVVRRDQMPMLAISTARAADAELRDPAYREELRQWTHRPRNGGLEATADGLATAPLSDTIEVDWPRQLLTDLLAGVGVPYVVVRLGYGDSAEPVPPAPRRRAEDVIEVSDT